MVCTNLSERDFFRQGLFPPPSITFYTKSSLQGVVALSFVPFWGGEVVMKPIIQDLIPSHIVFFFALAPEYEIASKSPSCKLGRVSVTVITW